MLLIIEFVYSAKVSIHLSYLAALSCRLMPMPLFSRIIALSGEHFVILVSFRSLFQRDHWLPGGGGKIWEGGDIEGGG